MKIKYLGHSCFKISGKSDQGDNVTIIADPFDPKFTGLPFTQQEADIVTISHHHRDHDYLEKIKAKNGELFVAEDPGEYEVKNLRIYGINGWHDDKQDKERGRNRTRAHPQRTTARSMQTQQRPQTKVPPREPPHSTNEYATQAKQDADDA